MDQIRTTKQRERLVELLKELFQLDQPDLDFGLYKIMHSQADRINRFLDQDLLSIVSDAFGQAQEGKLDEARAAVEAARQLAADFGVPDPDNSPKVVEAQETLAALQKGGSAEGDVYDHLYRFFERYYDKGDFMSRRYFARETDGKAAPYAVPYDGREVYLHWANRDQYYIKTSEHLANYSFVPAKAAQADHRVQLPDSAQGGTVHFRIVSASEGEHNNVKATENTERHFVVYNPQPVKVEGADLVLQFEYKALPGNKYPEDTFDAIKAKYSLKNKKGLQEFDLADRLLTAVEETAPEWLDTLAALAPTDNQATRPLLAKHIHKYVGKNSMDYFIHKDLGGFLRRELDFYIKNEIMRLDDLGEIGDDANIGDVTRQLELIRVLRKIARYLIDFLAQLEDFQKRLWLKKKFVTDTQYCITLDRIPSRFYGDIAANDAQRAEWVQLFAIDELDGYSEPLTVEFLEANDKLLIDTALYEASWKDQVLAEQEALDESSGGLLVHSENFQALAFLSSKFENAIQTCYIDPPYNTDGDDFPYKDSYRRSSWFTMMIDRAQLAKKMIKPDGLFFQQIGDDEAAASKMMLDAVFAERKNSAVARRGIKNVQAQFEDISKLSQGHDVIHIYSKANGVRLPHLRQALSIGKSGKWDTFWRGTDRHTMRYELFDQTPQKGQWRWEVNRTLGAVSNYETYLNEESAAKTLDQWYVENLQAGVDLDFVRLNDEGTVQYYVAPQSERLVSDNWLDIPASGSFTEFGHEKSLDLMSRVLSWQARTGSWVLDFFAGSGSTGHAAVRFGSGNVIRPILIEMGTYFHELTLPRIKKVVHSSTWKGGKPVTRDGLSHCFKYLRLESYEDAVNNIQITPKDDLLAQAEPGFRRDYTLGYWLDVESRGSASLLNVSNFDDPTNYRMMIKKPGSEESVETAIDLVETFNWLIGLHVEHLDHWRTFDATMKREADPELPESTDTRLVLDGALREVGEAGAYALRKVEGYTLTEPGDQSSREKTLVIWRKLTGDLGNDNLVLDEWFKRNRLNARDSEFDVIYVNGSNNLPNLRSGDETWKVRSLEEAFHQAMWDVED